MSVGVLLQAALGQQSVGLAAADATGCFDLAVGRAFEVKADRAFASPIESSAVGGEGELVDRRPGPEIDNARHPRVAIQVAVYT